MVSCFTCVTQPILFFVYNLIEYIVHSINLVNICQGFSSKLILSGKHFAFLVDFFHLPDPLSGEPKSKSAPLVPNELSKFIKAFFKKSALDLGFL